MTWFFFGISRYIKRTNQKVAKKQDTRKKSIKKKKKRESQKQKANTKEKKKKINKYITEKEHQDERS